MHTDNDQPRFHLTPCQQLLWRSQSASPTCPLFNQVISIGLPTTDTPDIDGTLWARAWTEVQKQHAALTTRLTAQPDLIPRQWASNEYNTLEIVCLPASAATFNDTLKAWIEQRKQKAFPASAAMTDAAFVYAENQCALYLNIHHLLADAWSTIIIWQALQTHYQKLKAQPANPDLQQLISAEDQSGTQAIPALNFFDYLAKTPWPESGHTNAADAGNGSEQAPESIDTPRAAQELLPVSFYQHINDEPDTRSQRAPLPLTDTERQQLSALRLDDQANPVSAALTQTSLHLAAFAIYLHRVSGDNAIVIELPLLGRFGKRWMNVAGNFIEMMQVTVVLNSDETITQVYNTACEALVTVLKQAKPGCSAALKTQTVHGVLNLITASVAQEVSGATTHSNFINWHHTGHSDMRHPLRLHVTDWNACGYPLLEVDINLAFFANEQRKRVPKHLAMLYRAMLLGGHQRVGRITLTTPSELWRMTGPTLHPYTCSAEALLYERIVDTAQRHPDAIALADNTRQISYAELLLQAHTVRWHLQQHSVGRDDRVAVLMQRSLELPIVLLGILSRGAAYIPIDALQPGGRVDAILSSADVKALIVDSTPLPHTVPITLVSTEILKATDADNLAHSGDSTSCEPVAASAADTAYIMYTSGSTGTPKGVVVSHGALMSYLGWACEYYALPDAINMPLFTSVGFDLTVTSLYLPWLSGGTLHVYPQSDKADALCLFDVMQNSSINTVKLTPAHLALLLESDCRIRSAVQLIVGGEDLKNSTALAIQARADHPLKLVNEYGPTEATVGCITKVWSAQDDTGSVPIGSPICGMSAYLLDNQGQPQFEGMTGELFLEGNSLADGYWGDAQLTHAAFVTTPALPGKRLYKTGDLARIENAELVYLGRKDTQVNINGYRIELSDIESAIMEHPAVSHCIVQVGTHNEEAVSTTTPSAGTANPDAPERLCSSCGLSSSTPDVTVDASGTCTLCQRYAQNRDRVASYFRSPDDLRSLVHDIKSRRRGKYDAVVLLSGGKDSTYALCQLVDLGLSVYALSLDNGYLSDHALANIDTVCQRLGVDHHFARTEHMDAIFNDSLTRYSNVCHGCFKTIYNLSMAFAAEHQIDTIFTGLSRGQLFETRLNNELFSDKSIPITHIDDMVVAARVQYHAIKDAPNTLLNIPAVNNGTLPSSVNIVDFYRYWHVEMADMLSYLKSRINWVRPPDTGRSTNCLINDVGIHVHKLERGFHNYAIPYSWDVRLGHKEREEALEELDDEIDTERVETILHKIKYTVRSEGTSHTADNASNPNHANKLNGQSGESSAVVKNASEIHALFTTISPLEPSSLRRWLQDKLPAYLQPSRLIDVAQLPLNLHGKVDRKKAFEQTKTMAIAVDNRELQPLSARETQVAELWAPYVNIATFHRDDNFFQLGGDSQAAIRCVMELRRQGYAIEPADLFKKPVLFRFAEFLDSAKRTSADTPPRPAKKFANLSDAQREKLSRLLTKNPGSQSVHDS